VQSSSYTNGLYKLDGQLLTCELPPLAFVAAASYTWSLTTWHKRFILLNPLAIKLLVGVKLLTRLALPAAAEDSDSELVCNDCSTGKGHRLPLPEAASHRATAPLQRIHSDLLTMSFPSFPGCQ